MSLAALRARGAIIPDPSQVFIGPEVDPAAIEPEGLEIHPGVRITGARTVIGAGTRLGIEGPLVLRDTAVGRRVTIGSGAIEGAVLHDGASVGPSCHIRPGTIMGEESSVAHAVGLKQTVLLPFAVLGSNINFCDALLYGGRSRRDHSEVGSGFIHFNFTPFGDKATPSLFGDVPRGVLLDGDRIFLGGQGGVVGPVKIGFGTVLAAGSVYRRDRGDNVLVYAEGLPEKEAPFDARRLKGLGRRIDRNLEYIGHLAALRIWYRDVRREVVGDDALELHVAEAGVAALAEGIAERIRRIDELHAAVPASLEAWGTESPPEERRFQESFHGGWPAARTRLGSAVDPAGADARAVDVRAELGSLMRSGAARSFMEAVTRFGVGGRGAATRKAAVDWLEDVVAAVRTTGRP